MQYMFVILGPILFSGPIAYSDQRCNTNLYY